MRSVATGLLVALVLVAGCGVTPSPSPLSPASPASPTTPVTPAAPAASSTPSVTPATTPTPAPTAGSPSSCARTASHGELQGQAPAGDSLWALLFNPYPLPRAADVKIVWRMTGTGDLALDARGPRGQHVRPTWGPEAHGGSSWNRPGAEWGSGFRFPAAGCWTLTLTRGGERATIGLLVR